MVLSVLLFPLLTGTLNETAGATSLDDCKPCPQGKYCNGPGAASETGDTAAGYYSSSGAISSHPVPGPCFTREDGPSSSIVACSFMQRCWPRSGFKKAERSRHTKMYFTSFCVSLCRLQDSRCSCRRADHALPRCRRITSNICGSRNPMPRH